jgi:hypothetical protein
LARVYPRLEEDWLLIADRGFYDWQDWCTAADTGAALLWRFKSGIRLRDSVPLPARSVAVAAPTLRRSGMLNNFR